MAVKKSPPPKATRKRRQSAMRELRIADLTPEAWPAFEELFGMRGACGGCWCMFWRQPRKLHDAERATGTTKRRMKNLVTDGRPTGVLAFDGPRAVGWCAIAPRADYPTLARSRILRPVDDAPVWSVVCFYIDRAYRRKGLTVALLDAAVAYARERGAKVVEGYPVEPRDGKGVDTFLYTGVSSAFRKAGFVEVARRSETRPVMRIRVRAPRKRKSDPISAR
jgi:GNAT superfamily N-acetyltransferase